MVVGAALGWLAAARATMNDPAPENTIEGGLAPPLAAGRRAMSSGIAVVRRRKAWRTPAFAAALIATGAIALALTISAIVGG
jgi:hypothetical protein